jgi:hypothetical protein
MWDVVVVVAVHKVEETMTRHHCSFNSPDFVGADGEQRAHAKGCGGGNYFFPNFTPSINFWSTKLSTVLLLIAQQQQKLSPINHCILPFPSLNLVRLV